MKGLLIVALCVALGYTEAILRRDSAEIQHNEVKKDVISLHATGTLLRYSTCQVHDAKELLCMFKMTSKQQIL